MTLGPYSGDGGQPRTGDIVELGRPPRRRSRRVGSLLLACLVAATVVLVVARSGGQHRPPRPVAVTEVGHPILGVHAAWQLFGFGDSTVVAVQFARGQIIRTTIPRLEGDGLVSLVAARREVLVRPLDNVPGYVVPDGAPAKRLTGVLGHGGYLLPGPTPAQQWLDSSDLDLVLVGPGGKREQARLPESAQLRATQGPVISDSRGGIILTGASGTVYDANDGAVRTISALPIAVGPRNWLGLACDQNSCHDVVISTATWASRVLPAVSVSAYPWPWQGLQGIVSPDGATAAVIVQGQANGQTRLDLVSLGSGAVVRVPVQVALEASSQSLAWSPDSRWLFVVTARGGLAIIDARTGEQRILSLGLSGLSLIVIRQAAG